MYIGEIIKEYRIKNKISQRDFASKTSLSHSYINTLEKIYNPKTGNPYSVTTDVALEIAKAMNMSIEELLSKINGNQEFTTNPALKTDKLGNIVVPIPLLGVVKAGYDYLAQENWIGTVDLDKNTAESGEFFALKVKGDSMSPIFLEGDIVIIKKQNDCENNEVAVVIINGEEGTLKRVKKTEQGIILQPFNPIYGPVMFTNEEIKDKPVVIAGVFHELRRNEIKF